MTNLQDSQRTQLEFDSFFKSKPSTVNPWRQVCLLMDDSLNSVKAHWKSYFFYFIGYYFLLSIFGTIAVFAFALFVTLSTLITGPVFGVIFLFLLGPLLGVIIHAFAEGARFGVSYIHLNTNEGRVVKAAEAIKLTLNRTFSIFWITLLVDLLLIVVFLVVAGIAYGLYLVNWLGGIAILEALFEGKPLFVALIAMVFFAITLGVFLLHEVYRTFTTFALYFYVHREANAITAFKESVKLARGHFKTLFTARLAISFTMTMLSVLLTWVISGIAIGLNFFTAGMWPMLSVFISQPLSLFNTAVSLVAMLFCSGCAFISYAELYKQYKPKPIAEVSYDQ